VIDCKYHASGDVLYMLAGSSAGTVGMYALSNQGPSCVGVLANSEGHTEVVRGFDWDVEGGLLCTGGEDCKVCLWQFGGGVAQVYAPMHLSASAGYKTGLDTFKAFLAAKFVDVEIPKASAIYLDLSLACDLCSGGARYACCWGRGSWKGEKQGTARLDTLLRRLMSSSGRKKVPALWA
jgi:hypothetical protein